MKFSKYILMAAGCALFAACSSDDPAVPGENDNNQQQATGRATGFASFAINLPTISGTGSRAVEDQMGDPEEYAVLNGKVIVFDKASGTYVCSSDLAGMNWSAGAPGEVTTSSSSVARLDNINLQDASAQYVAVVVLNYDKDFAFPATGTKFSDWAKAEQTVDMFVKNGNDTYITMSSAPKYVAGGEPVILVDIDKTKIAQTEAEAGSKGAAAEVFVQRAVAKVSLKTQPSYDVASSSFTGDKVTIEAWDLDITNKANYPVQVTDGLATSFADIWKGGEALNRFFGNGTKFQRVFWALDPNYDKDITTQAAIEADFNVISTVTGNPAVRYAKENTFDIAHQKQGQTTRVVIKANYVPAGFQADETFFMFGASNLRWHAADLKAEIEARAKTQQNSQDVTVDLGANFANAGYHSLSEVTIAKASTKLNDDAYKAIAEMMGLSNATDKVIAAYAKGESYYIARVKHFGDADCPWSIGDPTYGGNNLKWLGRYGMVRNNWYEVNVNSITKPGSPVVPVIKPDTPDDENEYYISVTVNVLAWAKRTQNVDL